MAEFTVREAIGLLGRCKQGSLVILRADGWEWPSLVKSYGDTPDECRKFLEARAAPAVPTAEEVLKELDTLVGGNNPTLGDISRVAVIARRYIEHTRGQPDG